MFEDNNAKRLHLAKIAQHYAKASYFAHEIADEMLKRLQFIKAKPESILNCASKEGYASKKLQALYPEASVISLDCLPDFLKTDDTPQKVCAEAFALPFKNHSIDWIFCNQYLHWEYQIEKTLQEFRRVLKPGGLLFFSLLGQDTLKEVEDSPYQFFDMHEIGDALLEYQFIDPVMDMENMTINFSSAKQAQNDLKELGFDLIEQCDVLSVTMEIIYGHAWSMSQPASSFKNKAGESVFPIHLLKTEKDHDEK